LKQGVSRGEISVVAKGFVMIKKRWLFLFLLCSLLVACRSPVAVPAATATAIPPAAAGTLVVDPARIVGQVSPTLLGTNYGPWTAVPASMLPEADDSRVKAIRFPGGEWGDHNDLRPYQIDAFIDFTLRLEAMPVIATRLYEGTPEQAAELVRYTNLEMGYGVEYWIIGNEPTLYAAALQARGQAEDYDTEQFNREWRAMALAMREVDPDIKLLGPELHQFNDDHDSNPKDSADRDWMVEFLKANGDLVDVVTFHRYPFPRGQSDVVTVDDLRRHTGEWERTIPYLRGLIAEHTGRDLPIAVTEVNTHWNAAIGGEATPDSHYNAIWVAEMFGRLMRQDVFMVNHWLLAGAHGGWALMSRGEIRPSYYVYRLFSSFGTDLVHADSGVADVSVYAAGRGDGALTLLIVNLADDEQQVALQVVGHLPAQAELWRLDPQQNPEAPTDVTLGENEPLTLPAQSISLYVLSP
jgi:hypothetical protein